MTVWNHSRSAIIRRCHSKPIIIHTWFTSSSKLHTMGERPMPGIIDLLRGHPSTRLLATAEIQKAATSVLTNQSLPQDSYDFDRHPLHYGPDLGNVTMRENIGMWSAKKYGFKQAIAPERIVLTTGASNGLAKTLAMFTNPIEGYTRRAFIVTPVYFLACPIFQDCGFANLMTAISTEQDGTSLDFDNLISELEKDKTLPPQPFATYEEGLSPVKAVHSKHLFRYVMYCVPTFSNPTGTSLSLEARTRLVEIARKYDILLVSDDVYDFLGYNGKQPMKRLVTIDQEMGVADDEAGHTISNCSFSKLLGPGLRSGWIESPSPVLAGDLGRSGANHSGGAPCHFTSTIVNELLVMQPGAKEPVVDSVIRNIGDVYRERVVTMKDAIKKYLPSDTHVEGGEGGYFVWMKLPEGYSSREIAKSSLESGIRVGAGDGFEVPDGKDQENTNFKNWGERWMRLSFAYLEADDIVKGIKGLGDVIKKNAPLKV